MRARPARGPDSARAGGAPISRRAGRPGSLRAAGPGAGVCWGGRRSTGNERASSTRERGGGRGQRTIAAAGALGEGDGGGGGVGGGRWRRPVPTPSAGLPGSGGTSLLGAALPAAAGGGCASLLVHPHPRGACDSLDGRVGRGPEVAAWSSLPRAFKCVVVLSAAWAGRECAPACEMGLPVLEGAGGGRAEAGGAEEQRASAVRAVATAFRPCGRHKRVHAAHQHREALAGGRSAFRILKSGR